MIKEKMKPLINYLKLNSFCHYEPSAFKKCQNFLRLILERKRQVAITK